MAVQGAVFDALRRGLVIPACPLTLSAARKLDERRQRALVRYYLAAGAGGLAVGVHTTQFAIRDAKIGLFEPVLRIAAEEMKKAGADFVRVGGVCGRTEQAVKEAALLRDLGYHAGLLSLGAMKEDREEALIEHAKKVAEVIPVIGFYLQPAVGGRVLSYRFWRRFAEIENVAAIKIAPFNRYQTIDVMRAVAESGRSDIALYTGNDDSIIVDLVTPFFGRRIVGGLLGHWAVWTKNAAEHLKLCQQDGHVGFASRTGSQSEPYTAAHATQWEKLLRLAVEVTDANAAFFDAANGFAGCIAGLHEVLRRQGLLEGIWCLDPNEGLSPGQKEELDRVYRAYPHLNDDQFVAEHRDEWLR
jgi:dihydrodipicolinate synthase/N-acetylneuraminate lyase